MISVAEARAVILERLRPLSPETLPLTPAVLGRALAEDVASDLDLPPFDKAMMDGYAVRSGDLRDGKATLAVVEEITAGRTPRQALGQGQAARIMTGAPVPAGADAVVMVEYTQALEDGRVAIEDKPPKAGQNIMPRGKEMRSGEVVLNAGAVLGPAAFGLLATVGRTEARIVPAPRVAIIATGDELVEAGTKLQSGQIRNSNGPMLVAMVCQAGCRAEYLGIARDDAERLRKLVDDGLQADVLVLSGGVSAGALDLVPGILEQAGVEAHFHRVAMKPGKPVFFGTGPRGTAVFGLPGNPVSSLVCFELFVRPALRCLGGRTEALPPAIRAKLAEDFRHRSDRPTYHPAVLEESADGRGVQPVAWLGSPDLKALARANALVVFPPGERMLAAGEVFDVIPLAD
jgi:molybdopterin molybdotransferase